MDGLRMFDPTVRPNVEKISYAPRPGSLSGLQIGLVENTKFNSDRLLLKVAAILEKEHGAAGHLIRRNATRAFPRTRRCSSSWRTSAKWWSPGSGIEGPAARAVCSTVSFSKEGRAFGSDRHGRLHRDR